jgi:hypothetical protein
VGKHRLGLSADEFEYDEDTEQKHQVEYEHQTIERDGKTHRVRTRIHPESDFEYILEESPDGNRTITKRLKQFERHQDARTNRIYRRQTVEMEEIEMENGDGTVSLTKVPKPHRRIKMMGKDGQIIDVVQFLGGSGPGHRARRRRVIRRHVDTWPVEDGVVRRSPRRKVGLRKDLAVHAYDRLIDTPTGLSQGILSKLNERQNLRQISEEQWEYDDPLDVFELDEDGCYRPLGDNRDFARWLFTDAMQRKFHWADLLLAISDTRFEIGKVLANERLLQHEITVLRVATKKPRADAQTQDQSNSLDDMELSSSRNAKILKQIPEIEQNAALLTEKYNLSCQRLETNKKTMDEMINIGEQLEKRYRLVRPLAGVTPVHPSSQRRIDLEQALAEAKDQVSEIASRTQERSDQAKRLKSKIEDQKCANATLYQKTSEGKTAQPQNVRTMARDLEELRKKACKSADSVRLAGIEDACVQRVIAHAETVCADKRIQILAAAIEELREKIAVLQENARKTWDVSDAKKLEEFAKLQISAMEAFNGRLDAGIQQVGDERLRLKAMMEKAQSALTAKTGELRDDFFQTFPL